MYTLEEVYEAVTPLPSGCELWPDNPMFAVCDVDGVVIDRATGLMWTRDANLDGLKTWQEAVDYIDDHVFGYRSGWRLPTLSELKTLTRSYPSDGPPDGHPFDNLRSAYWSGTTDYGDSSSMAWFVYMDFGAVDTSIKDTPMHVWPVRGGND